LPPPPSRPPVLGFDSLIYFLAHLYQGTVTFESIEDFDFSHAETWFTDGSCHCAKTPFSVSAGVAVSLIDGTPGHGRYFCVGHLTPDPCPQTSFFGEFTGLSVVMQYTSRSPDNKPII
jgi:hypothetical protein